MGFLRHLHRMPLRYAAMTAVAGAITVSLFYMMYALIDMGAIEDLDDAGVGDIISIVRLEREEETPIDERELPPKAVEDMPPPPVIDTPISDPRGGKIPMGNLDITPPPPPIDVVNPDRPTAVSAGVVPLVRVQPIYPPSPANQRIEGWVELSFDITPTGSVKSPRVVRAYPSDVFNAAALQAIRKWKYRPKVENGQKVAVNDMKVRLTFELDDLKQ